MIGKSKRDHNGRRFKAEGCGSALPPPCSRAWFPSEVSAEPRAECRVRGLVGTAVSYGGGDSPGSRRAAS